jgi:hypothetical protein
MYAAFLVDRIDSGKADDPRSEGLMAPGTSTTIKY